MRTICRSVLVVFTAVCCMAASEISAAPVKHAAAIAKKIFGGNKITGKQVKIPTPPSRGGGYSSGSGFNIGPVVPAARQAVEAERRRREEEQRRRSGNPWYY